MPRGHKHDPIYLHQYLRVLFRPIFLYVFIEKDCNGKKKDRVPCLDVIMIAFLPRNIHWSSLFGRKGCASTEWVPPGHPIILLKGNKFNMAAVLLKRSIAKYYALWRNFPLHFLFPFASRTSPNPYSPGLSSPLSFPTTRTLSIA